MDVWGWSSPIAWALFLAGCGATTVMLGIAFRFFGQAVEIFVKLPVNKKR